MSTATQRPTRSGREMTDEEAAALRAQVPDSPVKRPADQLACDACGVGVTITSKDQVRYVELLATYPTQRMPEPVAVARCSSCQAVADEASAYIAEHPEHEQRMGNMATERVEQALFALAVLDRPRPSPAVFEVVWPRLWQASLELRWSRPGTLDRGQVNPRPWAHVTLGQRHELRTAYAAGLRDLVARNQPPAAVPCPSGGCMLCGVSRVARGRWQALTTTPSALGASGPGYREGHVCPACAEALDSEGAVGQPARAAALVAHARATLGEDKARRLQNLIDDDPPTLPAWAAMRRAPSRRPWEHLASLLGHL